MSEFNLKDIFEERIFCTNCNKSKSLCRCDFVGYKYAVWVDAISSDVKEFIRRINERLKDELHFPLGTNDNFIEREFDTIDTILKEESGGL